MERIPAVSSWEQVVVGVSTLGSAVVPAQLRPLFTCGCARALSVARPLLARLTAALTTGSVPWSGDLSLQARVEDRDAVRGTASRCWTRTL